MIADATAPALEISGLNKSFKSRYAVREASFTVQKGDVFGLLGPNGAGKTTIIRMIVGLVKPDSGSIRVFGFDPMRQRPAVLSRSSTILESPALYPKLTGFENLKAIAYSSGIQDDRQILLALDQIGLLERAKDRFETYSLGMKQRLCIAASLLTDPQLVILDEPTNGLDVAGMKDIRELIGNLAAQGRTVMLSSHLLNEVQQVCNRVAILQQGAVIAEGAVQQLMADQTQLRVRLERTAQATATTLIEAAGWTASVGLDVASSEQIDLLIRGAAHRGAEVNRLLAEAGIYASEIAIVAPTLEEAYLNLTNQIAKTKREVPA